MSVLGAEIRKLGFGLMRLPKLEDGNTSDVEQVKQMVDLFILMFTDRLLCKLNG